jgi:hypothetical protein
VRIETLRTGCRSSESPSRWVLVATIASLAGLITLGGVADRLAVTSPTVRSGPTSDRSVTTLVQHAAVLGGNDRYAPYLALLEFSPRAVIILDERVPIGVLGEEPGALVHVPYLHALTGAREVRRERVHHRGSNIDGLAVSGSSMERSWRLHVDTPGAAGATIFIWEEGGELVIADARLLHARTPTVQAPQPDSSSRHRPSLLEVAVLDAAVLVALLVAGGLVLPSTGVPRLIRAPVALLAGLSAQGAVGILRIPGVWSIVAGGAVALLLRAAARRHGCRLGWTLRDRLLLGWSALVLLSLSVLGRFANFFWVSPDSINYLSQSKMLADGALTLARLDVKRGVGQQALHAPGFALGIDGVQSLGLVILAASVILVAGLPRAFGLERRLAAWGTSLLLATALLAAPAVPIMAAYVNSHLLVAAILLAIALMLSLTARGGRESGQPLADAGWAVGVLAAGLVVFRPEGAFLAGLLLAGGLVGGSKSLDPAFRILGTATVLWNTFLAFGSLSAEPSTPMVVYAMLLFGIALLAMPAARQVLGERRMRSALRAVPVLFWVAAVLLIAQGGSSVAFVPAVIANIGQGLGNWGSFGVLMMIVALAVTAAPLGPDTGPGAHSARYALIAFVPLTIITKLGDGLERSGAGIEVLLSGGGRVGWGDSVNRMWTHVILIVMLLAMERVAQAVQRATHAGEQPRTAR